MGVLLGSIVDHDFDSLVGRGLQAFFNRNNFIGVGAYVPTNNFKPKVVKTFTGFSISTVDLVYYHVCDEQLELIHDGYTRLHMAYTQRASVQKIPLELEVEGAWLLIQSYALRNEEFIAEGDKAKSAAGNKAIREVSKEMGQQGTFFLQTAMPKGVYLQKVYGELIQQLNISPHLWPQKNQKLLRHEFLRLVKARVALLMNQNLVELLNLLVKAFKREIDNREMSKAYAQLQLDHQNLFNDMTQNIQTTRIMATAQALIVGMGTVKKKNRAKIIKKFGDDAPAILQAIEELLAIPQ